MRIYSRSEGESLIVGDDITVTVLEVGEDFVRLRIEAPNAEVDLERESFEVTVPAVAERRLPR
jgi:carbon storage regulator CsrA